MLLGPVLAQNDAIRAYQRSRRTAPDVDPTTGIVEDAAPAGDEDGAIAPGSEAGEGAPN